MAIRNTGSGDYLIRTSGGFYDPTAMSVAFWANLLIDKDASGAVFGLRNTAGNNGYVYFYNSNGDGLTYTWEHFNGALIQLDANPLSLGVWHFIALSRAGTGANQTTAYRRQAGDAAFTSQTGTFDAGQTINEEIVLTNGFNPASGWFPGRIAALKQWSAALSAAELWQESQQIMPVRLADLHSWRPMVDRTVADAAIDYSGNGRALTPNGALTIEDGPPIPWRQGARRFITSAIVNAEARFFGLSHIRGMAGISMSSSARIGAGSGLVGQAAAARSAGSQFALRSSARGAPIASLAAQAAIGARTGIRAQLPAQPLAAKVSVKLATHAIVASKTATRAQVTVKSGG